MSSTLSQFRDALTSFMHMFGDWTESKVPIEQQIATMQDKESSQFMKATEAGTQVGKQAELIVQSLAAAQSLERQQVAAIEAHARQASACQSKGDVEGEAEHVRVGQMLSAQLADTRARLVKLNQMASEATNNQEEINRELQRQARKLSEKFDDDKMTALEYRMADGRDDMLKLQQMVYNALPGDRNNQRARITAAVEDRVAETNARSKMWTKIWADQKLLADTEDMQIAIQGEDTFKQIASGVGYKALPPAGGTSQGQ